METKDFKSEFDVKIKDWTYEAYAAVKNNIDSMKERIKDGAFTKTLKERVPKNLIKAFWRHRDPMGLPTHIEEDSTGLFTVTKVSETRTNEEYMILMKDKVVDRMSIGYDVIKDDRDNKEDIRDLTELKLYEYSPVPIAANEEALLVSVKSLDGIFGNLTVLLDKLEEKAYGELEMKPYPNEHSARLKSPDLFDSKTFRRKADGTIYGKIKVPSTISVIWAKLKEHNKPADMPLPQALRFPTGSWTESAAKKWLEDNNVKYESFEPASKEFKEGRVLSTANKKKLVDAVSVLQEILAMTELTREKELENFVKLVEDMRDLRVSFRY